MSGKNRWNEWIVRMRARIGRKRVTMIGLLIIAGLASIVIRLLVRHDLDHSAMLYLAVPYGVAVLITLIRPYGDHDRWWERYISHSVSALVVFLMSSVVLFEGFICVLFFMPIYFLVVTLAFIAHWIAITWDARKNRTLSLAIPLLVAVLSVEGTVDTTTLDRRETGAAIATSDKSPQQLLRNLATPFALPASSDWMLGLFPMPHAIEAGSLQPGDVHRVHMRYHRWFVTNTHEGVIELRIDSVTPEQVSVSIIRDTSYFSNYVQLEGSEIRFAIDERGQTEVSLEIHYQRLLDPAWYFRPIQNHAMDAMASHLIEEVVIRD